MGPPCVHEVSIVRTRAPKGTRLRWLCRWRWQVACYRAGDGGASVHMWTEFGHAVRRDARRDGQGDRRLGRGLVMSWIAWACTRISYWIRPYDLLADRRRWFWQRRTQCASPLDRAELAELATSEFLVLTEVWWPRVMV